MINKKISTTLGTAIIILIAGIFGFAFLKSQPISDPNETIEMVKITPNQQINNRDQKQNEEQETGNQNNAKEDVQNQEEVENENEEIVNKEEIDTSDWKTCRNEKNGYEFKYPDTWRLGAPVNRDIDDCNDQIEKENLYLWSNVPGEIQKATFSINANFSSLEEFISQNKSEVTIEKELKINNNKAIVYTKNDSRGKVYLVKIFKDSTSYTITATQLPSKAIFDALVANFKLLN
jgi:hypothetical protein